LDLTLGKLDEDIMSKRIWRIRQIEKILRQQTPQSKTKVSPEGEGFNIPDLEIKYRNGFVQQNRPVWLGALLQGVNKKTKKHQSRNRKIAF